MSKKTRGNKVIGIRGDKALHAKLATVASSAGVDRSTVVRFAVGWLNETQLTQLITAQRGQQTAAQHGQS